MRKEKIHTVKGLHALLLTVCLILCFTGYAQHGNHKIDSIYSHLKTTHVDTLKVNDFLYLAAYAEDVSDFVKSDSFVSEELKLSGRIKYNKGLGYGHIYLGLNAYYEGNYARAVEEYFKGLAITESIHDKRGEAMALNNIGLSYNMLGDYDHAREYYSKGLKIKEEMGDKRGMATTLNNIGLIFYRQNMYDSALVYFNKANEIKDSYGDKRGMASTYNNIGDVYMKEGKYDDALDYMQKGLAIKETYADKYGIVSSVSSIAQVYFLKGQYDKALESQLNATKMAYEIGALDEIQDNEKFLSAIYEKKNDGAKALEHYKAYIKARDSIYNKDNTSKMVQAEMNFQFEKKQAEAKAEQDKKDAVEKEQAQRQRVTIYFISGILLLVFVFAIFVYRSYLQKQKANDELDEKNKKIEGAYSIIAEKNREITDSITYAKRIQRAMLPSKEELKEHLPHSFVLFKPKAIVSGDFYLYVPAGDKVLLAAADCTGHGVPGAFMSMIATEKLHDAIEQATDTGEILSRVNKGIKVSLHQSDEDSTRDGMDIALCALSAANAEGDRSLLFSGANRPLWIIRNGSKLIEEVKPDKKAIGGFTEIGETFKTNTLTLNKGDRFYIFSDGYADQFGGPESKKLTTRKFKELLLSLCDMPMSQQKKELSVFIEKWKGGAEQLDDILVIGVRV